MYRKKKKQIFTGDVTYMYNRRENFAYALQFELCVYTDK